MIRIITVLALVLAASAADAHSYRQGGLEIGHPWSRPAAQGMNGAGYLSVTNTGATPDRLLAVETPAAARVVIHQTSMAGGIMRMMAMKAGLAIPAGARVELAPGGSHIMLLKLQRPFAAGDKVPAVLVFEKAGRVAVTFSVQAGEPAKGPEHRH